MRLGPIILRELLAESRRRASYWYRIAGAGWCLFSLWVLLPLTTNDPSQGIRVFSSLSLGIFVLLWLIGPVLTADCLSSERREQTLPLLFLTPLTPMDVVLAKAMAQMVRAITIWLAAFPILVLPALLGGVTWLDALRAGMLQGAAMVVGLASGLVASSLCRSWWMSLGLAMGLSGSVAVGAVVFHALGRVLWNFQLAGQPLEWELLGPRIEAYLSDRLDRLPFWNAHTKFSEGIGGLSPAWGGTPTSVDEYGLLLAGMMLAGAFLISAMAVRAAAAFLKREAVAGNPGNLARNLHAMASEVRFDREAYQTGRRNKLNQNPFNWLGTHSWKWRLGRWGICLLVCVVEVIQLERADWQALMLWQDLLFLGVAVALAAASVSGMRQEFQSGVMELLLTSPVPVWTIVAGRLKNVFNFIAPSAIVLFVCWGKHLPGMEFGSLSLMDPSVLKFALSPFELLMVASLGIWFSSRKLNSIAAVLLTLAIGVGIPMVVHWGVVDVMWNTGVFPGLGSLLAVFAAIHLLTITLLLQHLVRRLSRRTDDLAGLGAA